MLGLVDTLSPNQLEGLALGFAETFANAGEGGEAEVSSDIKFDIGSGLIPSYTCDGTKCCDNSKNCWLQNDPARKLDNASVSDVLGLWTSRLNAMVNNNKSMAIAIGAVGLGLVFLVGSSGGGGGRRR